MQCTNCGAECSNNAKFCTECGTPLKVSLTCPSCGNELQLNAKFCPECGTPTKGMFTQPKTATKIIVDATGLGNFRTITEALKNATDGTEIIVQSGVYNEYFVVDKKVSIIGVAKPGVDCPVIWFDTTDNNSVITIESECTLSNLEIKGSEEEFDSSYEYPKRPDDVSICDWWPKCVYVKSKCNLENLNVCYSAGHGIVCNESSDLEMKDCSLFNNSRMGLMIRDGGMASAINIRVYGNHVHGYSVCDGASLIIQKGKIYNNKANGILCFNSTVSLEKAEVYENIEKGLSADGESRVTIKECKIHDCEKKSGIALCGTTQGEITSCELLKCETGVCVYGKINCTIVGVKIAECEYGIGISEESNVNIFDSEITNFSNTGINLYDQASLVAKKLKIYCSRETKKYDPVFGISAEGSKNCRLENCLIYSTYDINKKDDDNVQILMAIYFQYSTEAELHNCEIKNCRDAIWITSNPNAVKINDCTIRNVESAVHCESSRVFINDSALKDVADDALNAGEGSLIEANNCTIENCDCVAYAYDFHVDDYGESSIVLKGCKLKNCKSESGGKDSLIHFDGLVQVREIKIKGNDTTYNTIGEALEIASDGDTILVPADEYNEHLVINKNVSIVGTPNQGKESPIIWCDTTTENAVIVIESECSLSNLEIKGAKEEFSHSYSYPQSPDNVKSCDWWPKCIYVKNKCSLSNLKAYYSAGHGIVCGAGASLEMRDCSAYKNSRMGLMGRDGAEGTISNCDFFKNHLSGLSLCDGTTISVIDCQIHENSAVGVICFNASPTIEGCKIYENSNSGLDICNDADCSIRDCKISKNGFGLLIERNGNSNVEDCDIVGNKKSGIKVEKASATIKKCKIHGGGASGIFFTEAKGCVENCDIYENHCGVKVSKNSTPTIKNCKIHDGRGDGISFSENSEGVVENCNIFMNSKEPIKVSSDSKPTIKSNKVAGLETDDDCED